MIYVIINILLLSGNFPLMYAYNCPNKTAGFIALYYDVVKLFTPVEYTKPIHLSGCQGLSLVFSPDLSTKWPLINKN